MTPYTDVQLDALRELANIGSGTASTALSQMLARPVDISVPNAAALSFTEAVQHVGQGDSVVHAVVLGVTGDLGGLVLLIAPPPDADRVTALLGVEPGSELADSALAEVGNVLGTSYLNSLAQMTGLELEPTPPQTACDLLEAIVASVLSVDAEQGDFALVLDSELVVEGEACGLSFMLLPSPSGVGELLARLGMA